MIIRRRALLAAMAASIAAPAVASVRSTPAMIGQCIIQWQDIPGAQMYQVTVRNHSNGDIFEVIVNPASPKYKPVYRFAVHDAHHVFHIRVRARMADGSYRTPGAMMDFSGATGYII